MPGDADKAAAEPVDFEAVFHVAPVGLAILNAAIVDGIVVQIAKHATDVPNFSKGVRARLRALGRRRICLKKKVSWRCRSAKWFTRRWDPSKGRTFGVR